MNASPNIGDRLQDNKPRSGTRRILTVEGLSRSAAGRLQVTARERPGRRLVRIAIDNIHAGSAERRTGFNSLPALPVDPRIALLTGRPITLLRGSRGRANGKGCERKIRAQLDLVDGIMVHATLLEDDPLASTAPYKAGESGCWHGLSFVLELA